MLGLSPGRPALTTTTEDGGDHPTAQAAVTKNLRLAPPVQRARVGANTAAQIAALLAADVTAAVRSAPPALPKETDGTANATPLATADGTIPGEAIPAVGTDLGIPGI